MGGRGSNSTDRLMNGGRKPKPAAQKWSRTTMPIQDRQGQKYTAYSNGGRRIVYKDAGDRYRVYDTKTGKTITQGHGVGLTFNKLKDAKQFASTGK